MSTLSTRSSISNQAFRYFERTHDDRYPLELEQQRSSGKRRSPIILAVCSVIFPLSAVLYLRCAPIARSGLRLLCRAADASHAELISSRHQRIINFFRPAASISFLDFISIDL